MRTKRIRASIVALLTVASILFSTAVRASAGQNDNNPFPNYMTVHFMLSDDEEASGTMSDVNVVMNSSFKLPVCTYEAAEGYMFDSYTICDTAYGSKQYKAGDTIVLSNSSDLYIWCNFKRDDKTVISFVPQWDDTCTGTMDDVVIKKNQSFTLPKCSFKPAEGYIFDYWYYDKEYKAGDKISFGNKREVTLFAVFKKDQSVLVVFDNGLKGKDHEFYESQMTYEIQGGKKMILLPEPNFKKTSSYKFKGWKNGKVGEYCEVPDTAGTTDKYPTIYAKMEKIEATKNLSDCTIKVKYVEKYSTRLSKKEVEIFENDIYCGKPITPIYTVKDAEGNLLKEGVDFTAEYSNNINAGKKAKIKLTGKGIYKGTKTAAFTIKKLQLSARRSTGSGDIFFADVQQNLKNMDAYEENGYRYYVHSGKTIKPDICKVYVFKAGKEYDIPLSNFTLEYPKKSKEIGGYEVKLISTGENIVINDRYTGDYLSSTYYIVPPTQHIRSAKIEKSGKYKGQLIVYFDPSGDYNVEIKVSMGKKFASDETLTFKVEGKGVQSRYIKLDKNWDKATKYIKVRYYKTGYWYAGGGKTVYTGKWSGVKSVSP